MLNTKLNAEVEALKGRLEDQTKQVESLYRERARLENAHRAAVVTLERKTQEGLHWADEHQLLSGSNDNERKLARLRWDETARVTEPWSLAALEAAANALGDQLTKVNGDLAAAVAGLESLWRLSGLLAAVMGATG